ncbi:uncharacterized protein LAESUDRAFT_715565 [Laetiporus sulphureus 93-53]|uniref:Uncharacterized protein n=1 Tax=Laetiporus sulphureus 93-53 TaxID=1314785 RepID=A0A165DC03_9APHY|nr:uncharacterized protein LAESUDRAFT_715565 [Laetiporus sulphureus 93-53]KZT04526.1 hypothetical protein LAESUDRAFT_715565 [Laetiporus sulphureus 93-53]
MADRPTTLPSPSSDKEAIFYYAGLPSGPRLVARTGTTPWKEPTGPEAYRKLKELRPVGNHPLSEVWEDGLALKIHDLLDTMKVKWTSIDVVRIRDVETSSAPVILWIGVVPASLSGEDGVVVASKCRELLVEYGITDVDVEIRESVITRSAGSKLLTRTSSYYSFDPTADVREPLTTTLGLPICAQSSPCAENTGGFVIAEGGNTKRLLLVTARHLASSYVTLFGDAAFNKYLESIKAEIGGKAVNAQYHEDRIRAIKGKDSPVADKERQHAQDELDKAKKAIEELNTFYQDISTHWAAPESRILGHVILSPPIKVGVGSSGEGYTEDWAVVEIDPSKVDASNFDGNAIDLGTRIPVYEFSRMMHPYSWDPRRWNAHSFTYPFDHLLKLEGTIPDEEMRHPTALDQNDEPCLMVIKRGFTTGLTVGRANNIFSYARNYYDDEKAKISKEWAILPRDHKSFAFPEQGDSGSVIVDGRGRIGGLLTGGVGETRSSDPDVTYATPISFLLKRMRDNGLRIDTI